jgi:diguanylate cyclase (GGDEF)-like protein
MRSFRTRLTVLTVLLVVFAVGVVSTISVYFIRSNEQRKSDQLLLLMCETGEKNLDYYFNSVQKSVERVASYVEADLDDPQTNDLGAHVERVRDYFDEMAHKTNGVLTYYYRIDPEVSKDVKGFWYTNLDGSDFVEHKVTDITLYDTSDTSKLVWFTVPKYKGESIWLPPYITDNLNKRVISYNIPVYWNGKFIGVVGIEIDYSVMAEQVDSIRLYSNGYAFLSDHEGNLFYHPHIDVSSLTEETKPAIPEGLVSQSTFISYNYDGNKKVAAWLPLSNGMRLVVSTPVSEAEGDWQKLVLNILLVSVEVLVATIVIAYFFSKRIAKPLKQLTRAAQQVEQGNYDIELTYDRNDEIGTLTKAFKHLASNTKEHIDSLSNRVFIDELTSVGNKAAFSELCNELEKSISLDPALRFSIGIFDCNGLKQINDKYGHDKGDIYLTCASSAISKAFDGCPVFRIGGDEFCVVLQGDDYQNREIFIERFNSIRERRNALNENEWEKINLAVGFADYERESDNSVDDVSRRADKKMYENKFSN